MRQEKEIKKRIKELKHRYLRREVKKRLRKIPENCYWNYRHILRDSGGKVILDEYTCKPKTIGLCMLGSEDRQEWRGDICEHLEDMEDCPSFIFKMSKKEIKEEFDAKLGDLNNGEYKDIKTLAWVLQNKEPGFLERLLEKIF